jgi:catechol 2,3-dioxygenase-like lactoylglutathione lyase family enzyme
MEMKIEVIMLPVSDIDASLDFYKNKLGFIKVELKSVR